jgi:hypothetical protein
MQALDRSIRTFLSLSVAQYIKPNGLPAPTNSPTNLANDGGFPDLIVPAGMTWSGLPATISFPRRRPVDRSRRGERLAHLRDRTGLRGNATGFGTLPFQISDIEKFSSRDSPRDSRASSRNAQNSSPET